MAANDPDEPGGTRWTGPVLRRGSPRGTWDRTRDSTGDAAWRTRWTRRGRWFTRWATVVTARRRSRMARRALTRRLGSILVAVAVGCGVTMVVARAEQDRRAWGDTKLVAVALDDLPAGTELRSEHLALREWPIGLVPAGAITSSPAGRRVTSDISAGEVIVAGRLSGDGVGADAALLSPDAAAVTVPLGLAPPTLRIGDRVDVLAPALGPLNAPGVGGVVTVARDAQVVDLGEGQATIVVRRSEVEATAAAILDGALTVALTG